MINIDISGGNSSTVQRGKKNKESYIDEEDNKPDSTKGRGLARTMQLIWHDRDCKKLFLFILLSIGVILVELSYGSYGGSLGMIAAAFHGCFDCISMTISLAAMVLSKHQPTKRFSYGYDRYEVLAGFSNGVFLLFVSFFLLIEIVERLASPEELDREHTDMLVIVAIIGIVVDVIGVVFFKDYAHVRAEHRHFAREENLHGIFAHLSIDTVASVGVIISVWLSSVGFLLADPLVAVGIVGLIIYNSIPICQRTGKVLLQTTPQSIRDQLDKALREAGTTEGVLECRREHFWTQSPGIFVGSLVVRVRSDANEQTVLTRVANLLSPLITHLTVQVEKDDFATFKTTEHHHQQESHENHHDEHDGHHHDEDHCTDDDHDHHHHHEHEHDEEDEHHHH